MMAYLFLQAPWLELDDGRVLSQSAAISMYCAGVAGFLPADPFQVARTVELISSLEDVRLLQLYLRDTCSVWGTRSQVSA